MSLVLLQGQASQPLVILLPQPQTRLFKLYCPCIPGRTTKRCLTLTKNPMNVNVAAQGVLSIWLELPREDRRPAQHQHASHKYAPSSHLDELDVFLVLRRF